LHARPAAVAVAVQLDRRRFAQRAQGKLDRAHVVAQVLAPRKFLEGLVPGHTDGEGALVDGVGEDGELRALTRPALLPLGGEVVANQVGAQALLDPALVVAAVAVALANALEGCLRVLDLDKALLADLGEPGLEGLGARRGARLDDPQQGFAVGDVGEPQAVVA